MTYRNMVLGKAKQEGLTVGEVCQILGVSRSIIYRLLDNPDTLNRGQLKLLCKYIKIPITTLLNSN